MKVFLDSSALVKRYIQEAGSDHVRKIFRPGNDIFVSIICLPEIISAASRNLREKKIAADQFQFIKKAIVAEYEKFHVVAIHPVVLIRTIDLLERHPLRTLDALHLACAVEIAPDLFVSADNRQILAGKKTGLQVQKIE